MCSQPRILFGITTKSHTDLGLDEMYGLQDLGFPCDQFEYGADINVHSTIGRFFIVIKNALKLLIKTYQFKPSIIYLNSRLEFVASTRDFITLLIVKILSFRKLNFIIKSHGSDLEVLLSHKLLYAKLIFPFLNRYVKGWLFLSSEEISWIKSKNLINKKRLFLVKNIVRPENYRIDPNFRKNNQIDEDCKILLYVGRLLYQKGIHYVIEAFNTIRKNNNVKLIIVGDGEESADIYKKIDLYGLKKDIILTGWVNEKEAAYYTSNSDVLIFPTFFPEGFPMVIFNSLAAGLCIITTSIRAAADYLDEPENCIWVKPKSSDSIETAVSILLNNESLMKEMRINNKKKSLLFVKKEFAKELSAIIKAITYNEYNESFIEAKVNKSTPSQKIFE